MKQIDIDRQPCAGVTAKGRPCRHYAVEGTDMCPQHLHGGYGRPSKLTPQLAERIVRHVMAGALLETAALASGICRSTLHNWMNRAASGLPEDEGYRLFRERVEQAQAEGEVLLSTRVLHATQDSPEYAMWLLERRHPGRWGRPSQREDVRSSPVSYDPFTEPDEVAAARRRRRDGVDR